MENYIGRLLDSRYEILEIIGTGGMAVVYRALDHRLNRSVAVKILKDEFSRNQEFRRRFHAESQAVAMLSHPNIVNVYDVSRDGEADYIVMELIEGISLKQYLERKSALNWRETLHFSMQIAKALEHAHGRGIIHRDIKPHNIMILKDGSIKVADFGIARVGSGKDTLTREALGSVHYISPEQAKGARVDNRGDLYSLGVVMYEMLTGRTPYDGETPVAVAIQHINGGAKRPGELMAGIPMGLEQITMHAMNSNAEKRYSSAVEMLRDMEEFRKNPSMTFHFGAAVPVSEGSGRTGMSRTEAERYAAARNAGRGEGHSLEARRAERAKREAEQAEKKRKRIMAISIGVAGTLAAILLVVFLVLILKDDSPELPRETEVTEIGDVVVFNFVGMSLEDIDPEDYPDLNVDVANVTYKFSDEYEEGVVMDQTPKAGDEVRKGRTVRLTVSKGKENNKMPDFKDRNAEDAVEELNDLKLDLQIEEVEEGSETVRKGHVIRTEPAAKTELKKGDKVTLYISIGSNKMPDLKDDTKENAQARLNAMELDLKFVFIEEESETVEKGKVTRTNPAADSDLSRGQQITIYISTGDGKVVVPPVIGFTKMEAIQLLQAAGLQYHVNEVYDAEVEIGKVISQSEAPNAKVEPGKVITIDVSKGPDPAMTEPPTQPPTQAPTDAPTEAPTEAQP